ncbi:PD-(D/E)XK motif protein [Opitutus sp. ER46]|uniref:PD-(D/E)XK motif protein n=1 Tax=Opitutus sp. ER46 TaxID=2161864 RepID=UPI000D314391|nr:PD-(D/E)XK motif protein [Opitutus sp. ER46]PTX92317.1 hypothetical protein DB354_13315 [Opitutus sp. ER46]
MIGPHTWKQLAKADAEGASVVGLRLLPSSKLNVFAALDRSSAHRFLLLKANLKHERTSQQLPSGRGFAVRFVKNSADSEGHHCLQFELTDSAHAEIFDVVANDMLDHIGQCHDVESAFSAFLQRIAEWQTFLNQLPSSGLGDGAQQGLFAELWFLQEKLLSRVAPLRAIASWAGPKRLAKDFQFPGIAIEVKTTTAKQHSTFAVSNEMQLDASGVGRLFVYGLLMERLVAGGTSLPEIVESVRATIQREPDAYARFSELLLLAGYVDSEAGKYSTRYAVRSQDFFEVRDEFPRIVGADIRKGVGDVKYSIAAAECAAYRVEASTVYELIERAQS